MAEPPAAPPQRTARAPGRIASLLTLPFRLFGALCGSLLLSVLIEWLGMHFFWPAQSWHHAQAMLTDAMGELSAHFRESLLLLHPVDTAQRWVDHLSAKLFHSASVTAWMQRASTHPVLGVPHFDVIAHTVSQANQAVKPYALAAGYTLLTFLVRLLVLVLTLPLFSLAALVGLVDGLVRRDLRRFSAGYESGFVYHRARAMLAPAAMLPWGVYLASPIRVPALVILLPAAALLAMLVNITAASFKKYL